MSVQVVRSTLTLAVLLLLLSTTSAFNWTQHLATKTPYRVFSSAIPTPQAPPEGCKLVFSNLVARHGTRNPTESPESTFNVLQAFLGQYAHQVSNASMREWMETWRNPFPAATSGFIVESGLIEHYELGSRFAAQYGELIGTGGYNPVNTTFQNTKVERTATSAQAFAAGLYNQHGTLPNLASPIYSYNMPKDADPTLRPFDMCPQFEKAYEGAKESSPQDAWLLQYLPDLSERFSTLFGTHVNYSVCKMLYEACAYQYAVQNIEDHFCALFTEQDFKVFEYGADLEEYYTRSYGLPIAVDIGAPLLSDLVSTMENKFQAIVFPSPASDSSTYFRFAHAETIEPILSILGLYKDPTPPKADWTWAQIEARQFRTSWLFPFASNLAMFGYDCIDARGLPERFYIRFQHNERDVTIPSCETSTPVAPFCGFYEFKTAMASPLAINFEQMCNIPAPTPIAPVPTTPTPAFHAIYIWGPITLMATLFVSFVGGFCVGTRRPLYKRKEPLLSAMEHQYQ